MRSLWQLEHHGAFPSPRSGDKDKFTRKHESVVLGTVNGATATQKLWTSNFLLRRYHPVDLVLLPGLLQ